jgi:hypothetical protein
MSYGEEDKEFLLLRSSYGVSSIRTRITDTEPSTFEVSLRLILEHEELAGVKPAYSGWS